MSEQRITLRQLMAVVGRQIAWLRIYTNAQNREQISCMNREAMYEAVKAYGDKPVIKVQPGYYFVIIYLDR